MLDFTEVNHLNEIIQIEGQSLLKLHYVLCVTLKR